MKFRKSTSTTAISDCGLYEIRVSRLNDEKQTHYYNAWCGEKHIAAGFKQAEVREECRRHRERVTTERTTGEMSGNKPRAQNDAGSSGQLANY